MSKYLASLPKGWKVVKIGDVCQKPNYGHTASATNQNTGFKFLRITDIQNGLVNWESVPYCECNKAESQSYLLQSGDLLIARIGATTGKTYFIREYPPASVFASYLIRLRAKTDNLFPEFLSFYSQTESYWEQIDLNKGGRLKGGVNIPILQSLVINLPPLEEQRAIATTLRTIQTAKEARQKELTLERERKAALMDYLFTHGTRNEPRKQTDLGEIPESWDISKLGDLGEINGGGTPSTKVPEYWNGEIAWLVPSEVTKNKGIYISKTVRRITQLGLNDCSSKLFPIGTVMMTSRATIGEVVINQVPMATNQGFINIGCHENLTDNEFLAYWIKKNKTALEALGSGVTFKEISRSTFKTIKISLPPLDEQKTIANVLSSCDAKIATLEREIKLHDELFRAMLEELMTGQLSSLPLA